MITPHAFPLNEPQAPCVDSRRLRVCIRNVPCGRVASTQRRFECTDGGVLNLRLECFQRDTHTTHCTPTPTPTATHNTTQHSTPRHKTSRRTQDAPYAHWGHLNTHDHLNTHTRTTQHTTRHHTTHTACWNFTHLVVQVDVECEQVVGEPSFFFLLSSPPLCRQDDRQDDQGPARRPTGTDERRCRVL